MGGAIGRGGEAMAGKTVTRVDLCEAIYQRLNLSRTESAQLLEQVLDKISECIVRGEVVKFSSFGAFTVRSKRQRVGRNPKTGQSAVISSRRVLVFKPSTVLKQRISRARVDEASPTDGRRVDPPGLATVMTRFDGRAR